MASQSELKKLKRRADETDAMVDELQRTVEQLKTGGLASSSSTDIDRKQVIKQLREIRKMVVAEENQLKKQQNQIGEQQNTIQNQRNVINTIKTKVRTELVEMRKKILAESARANPKEFRDEVARKLKAIRKTIVEEGLGSGGNGDANKIPPKIAKKIIADLKVIRNDVSRKEKENVEFRSELRKGLLQLRAEVSSMEEENKRLKNGGANGNSIPPALQAKLTASLRSIKADVVKMEIENKRLRLEAGADPLAHLNSVKTIQTVDMHSGGEPLRIVVSGYPDLRGDNLLEKRANLERNVDDYRKFLMSEPRGHFDMYGAILTEPDDVKEADVAAIFLHNGGYSTMCGHAIMCLGRFCVDFGIGGVNVQNEDKTVEVRIQTPCGVVRTSVAVSNGKSTGDVQFVSAPCWAEESVPMTVSKSTEALEAEISYGGTYYAIVPASHYGLEINTANIDKLIAAATDATKQVKAAVKLQNPDSGEMEFVYGTILTQGNTNVTVFADRQVDRSPTGSGVMARMALDFAKKRVGMNEAKQFVSITGAMFEGAVVDELEYKGKKSVRVEVRGASSYTGRSTFYLEDSDVLGAGFLIK